MLSTDGEFSRADVANKESRTRAMTWMRSDCLNRVVTEGACENALIVRKFLASFELKSVRYSNEYCKGRSSSLEPSTSRVKSSNPAFPDVGYTVTTPPKGGVFVMK